MNTVNLLLVDDLEVNLLFLEKILQDLNNDDTFIKIHMALNGEEALSVANSNRIDLAILDINMPGMSGFELAKLLKINEKTRDINIVFLTGSKEEQYEEFGYHLGAVDYFVKPIIKQDFLAKIKLYLPMVLKNNSLHELNERLNKKIAHEIELNKQHEQNIVQQSRFTHSGEMISMIAHQWRQPLGSISAITQSIMLKLDLEKYDLSNPEELAQFIGYLRESLSNIERKTIDLSKTIDTFRNFYNVEDEKTATTFKKVVHDAINIMGSTLSTNKIMLHLDLNDETPIDVYINKLLQVMIFLLKNADENFANHDIQDKEIRIVSKDKTLTISDNGGGIDDAMIDKIFDPYFTTKKELNGAGLGLYISNIIIKNHHNGSITYRHNYDDENKKIGAAFTITLP